MEDYHQSQRRIMDSESERSGLDGDVRRRPTDSFHRKVRHYGTRTCEEGLEV